MLKIRLRRMGSKQAPFYRVVVSDSRSTPGSRFVDTVGYYDPGTDPATVKLDVERIDTAIEAAAIAQDPEAELEELTAIYVHRGVEPELARQVAHQLMEKDALDAHLREELGLTDVTEAKPLQAALSSGLAFGVGAGLPLLCALVVPTETAIALSSVGGLFLLGLVSSWAGGGVRSRSVMRVVLWGSAAMALTWLVGSTV